jgi:hypothetical protein
MPADSAANMPFARKLRRVQLIARSRAPEAPTRPRSRSVILGAEVAMAVDTQAPATRPARRWRWKLFAAGAVVTPALLAALYTWITLRFAYSSGERAGYVQKLSRKGWVCKTWEGELAMVSIPGSMPEIFHFSVRSDSLARVIQELQGGRVALEYEQKKNVPTSCFGDTDYHVVGVRPAAM